MSANETGPCARSLTKKHIFMKLAKLIFALTALAFAITGMATLMAKSATLNQASHANR